MRRSRWAMIGLARRAIGLGSVLGFDQLWSLARRVTELGSVLDFGQLKCLVQLVIEWVSGSRGWIGHWRRRGPLRLGRWR